MKDYLLRNIDADTWKNFGEKCGRTPMREVLLRVVLAIVRGKVKIHELPELAK